MPLLYLVDAEGNRAAVLIPIAEWNLITQKHEDLKKLELHANTKQPIRPSDLAGSMPADIADDFHKHVEESR